MNVTDALLQALESEVGTSWQHGRGGDLVQDMRQRLEPLCRILDKYGVTWVLAEFGGAPGRAWVCPERISRVAQW